MLKYPTLDPLDLEWDPPPFERSLIEESPQLIARGLILSL